MVKMFVTLENLPKGKVGVCSKINAGRGLERKLVAMGIFRGVQIKKIDGIRGPVLVRIGGGSYSFGYGIAKKILVEYDSE